MIPLPAGPASLWRAAPSGRLHPFALVNSALAANEFFETVAATEFLTEEARTLGAEPVVRFTLLPYPHPNGVDATGTFTHTSFISPQEIRAHYQGFAGGLWLSAPVKSKCGHFPTPAAVTWDWNSPGFDMTFSWRTAADLTALSAAPWEPLFYGQALQIQAYYQFRMTLEGWRCRACDDDDTVDDGFLAYAIEG